MTGESPLRAALTFDAEHPDRPKCPPDAPVRILDSLEGAGVRATFFLQGRWVEAYPDLARRVAAEGHLIGHHSKYHARMTLLTDEGIREDIREAEEAIRNATGADPRPWFRCPFGEGREDRRVLSALEELGYRDVHWDVEADDWEEWQGADGVRTSVVEGVATEGPVVLLHTWPGPTAEALPGIIEELRARDASFVTLRELIGASP